MIACAAPVRSRIGRRAFCRALGATLLAGAAFPAAVRASADGCHSPPSTGAVPLADPRVATALPAPFSFEPWRGDGTSILRNAAEIVSQQAGAMHAPSCFREKAASLVGRVDLLSPFEFLVATAYETDLATRDELLDLYARDPAQAMRRISPIYPSPRSEMLLTTLGYYDVTTERIRLNLGKLREEQAPRVVVHEFWHALPNTRFWQDQGGATVRASGFWIQRLDPGGKVWLPIDKYVNLPFPPFMLAEGMATMMETRYAGPPNPSRPDVEAAQRYLERVVEVAGPSDLADVYLDSRPADFAGLVESHGAELAELQPVARR